MKRVLDISTSPYFLPKGSALRIDAVLQYLSKDYKVDFVTYSIGEDRNYKNVHTFRTPSFYKPNVGVGKLSLKKIILDIFVFFKSFDLLLRNKYDVINCEDFEAAFIGRFFSIFFRKPKYVYDLHNRISDNLKIVGFNKKLLKIVEAIERWVVKPYKLIIINWRQYENDPLFKGKKIFQLYDRAELDTKEIKLPTKRYVAYSGNYKKYQGVEYFLSIYAKVLPSYDVILVGNVTEDVLHLIKEQNLENKVFTMGQLDIKESNYVLQNSICCLIPKLSEEHRGLKIVHHVMLGKVSLASDIAANRELLKDGYNAILYSSDAGLEKNLRMIDKEKNLEEKFKNGISDTQKEINRIWSYEYFKENYSKVFENEK